MAGGASHGKHCTETIYAKDMLKQARFAGMCNTRRIKWDLVQKVNGVQIMNVEFESEFENAVLLVNLILLQCVELCG